VLLGKALSDEELVDLLSLKDNDETLDDFYAALHILAKTKGLPESRQLHAFRSVWRRIYLHDECVLDVPHLSVASWTYLLLQLGFDPTDSGRDR
jgi:hypothetical protein